MARSQNDPGISRRLMLGGLGALGAAGAGLAVHEVYDPIGGGTNLHFRFGHAPLTNLPADNKGNPPVDGVGTVAANARVKTLALNHLVPADALPDATWINGASQNFSGPIIVGSDLKTIDVAAAAAGAAANNSARH